MEVVTFCFRRVFHKNEQKNGLEIDEICKIVSDMEEAAVSVKIDHVDIPKCPCLPPCGGLWATAAERKSFTFADIDCMVKEYNSFSCFV